jgi:predicted nucleic acid-binding Zn ribbon protein
LISSPAIQFRGSGWYVTDYARSSSGASGEKTEKKDGTAAESKPEGASAEKSGEKKATGTKEKKSASKEK